MQEDIAFYQRKSWVVKAVHAAGLGLKHVLQFIGTRCTIERSRYLNIVFSKLPLWQLYEEWELLSSHYLCNEEAWEDRLNIWTIDDWMEFLDLDCALTLCQIPAFRQKALLQRYAQILIEQEGHHLYQVITSRICDLKHDHEFEYYLLDEKRAYPLSAQ